MMIRIVAFTLVYIAFLTSCSKDNALSRMEETADTAPLLENLDPNAESIFMQNATRDARVMNRSWQGIPSIAAGKDGREIYITWYTGGSTEGSGNYITVAASLNKGKTWMNDKLVVYPADPGVLRFFDPCLWTDKNNDVWLTWAKSHGFWDGVGGVWTSKLSWSTKGIKHSDVKQLCKGILMNKPTYIASKNEVLFPVSLWNLAPSTSANQGTFIYKSSYSGMPPVLDSLQLLSQLYVNDSIRSFDEHQIVELNLKGRMMCMVRTKTGICYAISMDYGHTWGRLRPFTAVGPTATSRFHISRLRSGKILLIANNSRDRTNLTAFLSSDEGRTWSGRLVLDKRANISYPDATQTPDGYIHVVYDRGRFREKEILYCKFSEKNIFSRINVIPSIVNSH